MKSENLETLENTLPGVFDRNEFPDWPDSVIVVMDGVTLDGRNDPFCEPQELKDQPADIGSIRIEDPREIIVTPDPGSIPDTYQHPLGNILDGSTSVTWPGQPVIVQGQVTHPPADCYAFYLPWHHFSASLWGIYLVVEGVEQVGWWIHLATRGHLSLNESLYVAKTYLFHHEAYHNVVESFAARQEIAFRQPVYKAGFRASFRNWSLQASHEEAMAESYAAMKVRKESFAGLRSQPRLRKFKQELAYFALVHFIETSAPPYSFASPTLRNNTLFDPHEHVLQEQGLLGSISPPLRPVNTAIWSASTHSMQPTLKRNGAFSYIVNRNHPLLATRRKPQIKYCDRRKFIQKLKSIIPGELRAGGVHPLWVVKETGQRVPIPTGSLPDGTANHILEQLGLKQKYRNWKTFLAS